jgi:peptidylprolyl isomerase/peptidyl-prolyl cis-trans isomerase B (cyclophilin B)
MALMSACGSTPTLSPISVSSPIASPMMWSSPPPMSIDRNVTYIATFITAKGEFRVQLFADKAPNTVNNFVFLARQGFYNNTTFHRVIKDFMAQAGDPAGTGAGSPGYTFADEIVPDLKFDRAGLLAMANSGPGTNGSQFFITFAPTPWLDGLHTIFGEVISGMDVVLSLTERDPDQKPAFFGDALVSVTISESKVSLIPTPMPTATPNPPKPQPNARPLATLEVTARMNRYDAKPALFIDLTHSYQAVLRTSKGRIVIDLYAADAPQSVNNFILLAQLGYWDGFPINVVDPGKYLLTGSPSGGSDNGIGYTLPQEPGRSNEAGAVGYWVRGGSTESSASAFYILLREEKSLDGTYTVFGKVVEGLDVASTLTTADRIESIAIIDRAATETTGP